ncbi:unnamed protein product [Owenia fusiformis]|uniref:G-protein coupled receptors family 1 profile domain-containing protein n=1 Tax=Owenia fusiformis TaxID=6347 RepID=A0A8S4Q5Q4_OWEFU|nr:unnamed protein product [Owenia fusiformis]
MENTEDYFKSNVPTAVDIVSGLYLTIVGILSITLNVCVLAACFIKRHGMRPMEMYIVFLAFIDLCMCVLAYPFVVASQFSFRWQFGMTGCIWYGFMGSLLAYSNIYTLGMIAAVRYLKTCHSGSEVIACFVPNKTNIKRSVCIAFFVSFLWSISPVIGWGEYDLEPCGTSCTLKWYDTGDSSYVICTFLFNFVLPLVAIVFGYSRIISKINSDSTIVGNTSRFAERRLTKVGISAAVCFLVTWGPYATFSVIEACNGTHHIPAALKVIPTLFAKSNTLCNPIIYYLIVRRFRNIVKHDVLWWIFGKREGNLPTISSIHGVLSGTRSSPSRSRRKLAVRMNLAKDSSSDRYKLDDEDENDAHASTVSLFNTSPQKQIGFQMVPRDPTVTTVDPYKGKEKSHLYRDRLGASSLKAPVGRVCHGGMTMIDIKTTGAANSDMANVE